MAPYPDQHGTLPRVAQAIARATGDENWERYIPHAAAAIGEYTTIIVSRQHEHMRKRYTEMCK